MLADAGLDRRCSFPGRGRDRRPRTPGCRHAGRWRTAPRSTARARCATASRRPASRARIHRPRRPTPEKVVKLAASARACRDRRLPRPSSLLNSTRSPPSSRSGPRTRLCMVNRPVWRCLLSGRNFSSPSMWTLRAKYWTPLVPPQPSRSVWTSSARPSPPLVKKVEAISPVSSISWWRYLAIAAAQRGPG